MNTALRECDIHDYLATLTDAEILDAYRKAESEMQEAIDKKMERPLNEDCLLTLVEYSIELSERGYSQADVAAMIA